MFEGYCRKNDIDGKEIVASISGNKVTLKVAANDHTKAKGLMGSNEPGDSNGMIFVYDSPQVLDFWMKNVEYDLDILFFDENLKLVDHFTMDAYNGESENTLKIYKSKVPAMYAIELKSGWYNNNIKSNDNVKLKI
jgi:uncharacterized membrane protein (UPF0127 family)